MKNKIQKSQHAWQLDWEKEEIWFGVAVSWKFLLDDATEPFPASPLSC